MSIIRRDFLMKLRIISPGEIIDNSFYAVHYILRTFMLLYFSSQFNPKESHPFLIV